MADEVLKKVRLNYGVFVEAFQQGRRKYAVLTDGTEQFRGEKYRDPYTEDQVIKETYIAYARKNGKMYDYYKVIQDPYKDPWPIRTTYGNGDKSPYYLNNGCKINIQWIGRIPNPAFNPGTYSNPGDAEDAPGAPERWLFNQVITSSVDDASNSDTLPKSTWVIEQPFQINQVSGMSEPNYRDSSLVNDKIVTVNLPDGVKEEGEFLVWTGGDYLTYNNKSIPENNQYEGFVSNYVYQSGRPSNQIEYFQSNWKDSDIIKRVIDDFKMKVSKIHGISTNDYNLQLCVPDTASCSVIPYKSPLAPENKPPETPETNPPGPTMSATNPKVKFSIEGLTDPIVVKMKTSLDTFVVWAGPIPKTTDTDTYDELGELDDEYTEGIFRGAEEKMAEFESPSGIPEVSSESNKIPETSNVSTYTPDPNAKPGTVVTLPRDYSHTSEQGFNLLNSQWIGDLIASAKSHIGHPTYDISGTEKGNLGCASAVSMMFYRAFGVHMKTGKAVTAKPQDIGSFGTKGTAEAAGWFENASLYQKITWTDAQPGDIMNTARNFSTNKAGHIGVVIDVKAKDGSWAIVSNSSKGFAGGGGGAVKQNYSVKAWQSVTDRNPTKTFAFRYIGPRLSAGQTA